MDSRRRYPRISVVDGRLTASLRIGDKHLAGLRITSLSLGGLLLFIDTSHTLGVGVGQRFEDLVLHHPDLPSTPFGGELIYTLGGGEGMDIMSCGVRFDEPLPENLHQALGAYIDGYLPESERPKLT